MFSKTKERTLNIDHNSYSTQMANSRLAHSTTD